MAASSVLRHPRVEHGPHPLSRSAQIHREVHRIRSVKAGTTDLVAGSALEAMALYRAEGDLNVTALVARPLRVHLRIGQRPHHTFALKEQRRNGEAVLVDVHSTRHLERVADGRDLPPGWAALEQWAALVGLRIAFYTDEELHRDRVRIANWRRLLPFVVRAREAPNEMLESDLRRIAQQEGALAFVDFPRFCSEPERETVYCALANLLHQGRLVADLANKPFGPATLLKSAQDE